MPHRKVWFVTGVSRGLGKALAASVLSRGDWVIGTSRDGTSTLAAHPNLEILPLDVTDAAAVQRTVMKAKSRHGRLDVVVNNAGYGLLGALEEATDEETSEVFAANFFGTLNVVRAVLPILRKLRGGHIVNVSSIAALAPSAGSALYAAAKGAVNAMSESLALEVEPLGIKVTVVEPGAFRTDFLSERSVRFSRRQHDDYASTAHAAVDYLNRLGGTQPGNPALAADAIVTAVLADDPPRHLVLGRDAQQRTRQRQAELTHDLDTWHELGASTDYVI